MPEMDGIAALKEIKANRSECNSYYVFCYGATSNGN